MPSKDTARVMAMRDQMNFDAISATDKHFKKEFADNTDPLVSFGMMPTTTTQPEEIKES